MALYAFWWFSGHILTFFNLYGYYANHQHIRHTTYLLIVLYLPVPIIIFFTWFLAVPISYWCHVSLTVTFFFFKFNVIWQVRSISDKRKGTAKLLNASSTLKMILSANTNIPEYITINMGRVSLGQGLWLDSCSNFARLFVAMAENSTWKANQSKVYFKDPILFFFLLYAPECAEHVSSVSQSSST